MLAFHKKSFLQKYQMFAAHFFCDLGNSFMHFAKIKCVFIVRSLVLHHTVRIQFVLLVLFGPNDYKKKQPNAFKHFLGDQIILYTNLFRK